ncbi:MAG: major facilitator superfamily 1 [Verrucomicrobiaceae bacterium]|nr:major facilitator superfamily 1 [Verrucomicrobiaceae bacterium]
MSDPLQAGQIEAARSDTSSRSDSPTRAHSAHYLRAVLALGVGGFSIGTGEFVIMGLLPEVARDVGVTIPEAGHLISAYALGVVIGAPVLAVLAARWPRRALLIALMGFYALANFATALVPGYFVVGMMRFASGLPHGTYFGVAALVAAALAPPNQRARAVGFVMLGLTTAMLLGVPLAAWLGQQFGWRAAFVLVGSIALLASLLICYGVPDLPVHADASPMRELGALARPQVWLTLAIAGIGFGGMFCVYSYIKPTLIEVSGLTIAELPLVLALFGCGGVVGNLIGARLADRALMPTIGGALVYSAVLLASFGTLAQFVPTAMLGVFLLGTLVSLGPALQIRLMDVAGDAQTLAAALNHSAFNFANALGAWLGGLAIIAGWGWTSLGWVGALLSIGGLVVFAASLALQRSNRAV